MKRLMVLLLVMALLAVPALAQAEIAITATSYPLYDLAKIVGGDEVVVTYTPDATIPEDAQIVLCMSDEAKAPEGAKLIRAVDGIDLIEGDTDVLTIPINNVLCGLTLAEALAELDPDNLETYNVRMNAYMEDMFALDAEIRQAVTEQTRVTCDDGSMMYFMMEYNVGYTPDDDTAILLHTYTHPAEEDLNTPYIDLMRRNLEALKD